MAKAKQNKKVNSEVKNLDKTLRETADKFAEKMKTWGESMRGKFRPFHWMSKMIWAFILISFGIIFLMNNFGILEWSIWINLIGILWKLWPLAIIMLGLRIIFGKSQLAEFILSMVWAGVWTVIVLFLLADAGVPALEWVHDYVPQSGTSFLELGEKSYVASTDEEIEQISIDIKLGYGEFSVDDSNLRESTAVIEANYYSALGSPVFESGVNRKQLDISFDTNDKYELGRIPDEPEEYDISINPMVEENSIPVMFALDIGAGAGVLKFKKSELVDFKLNIGAGEVDLNFYGDASIDGASFNIGAGFLKLRNTVPMSGNVEIGVGAGEVRALFGENQKLIVHYELGAGVLKVGNKEVVGFGNGTVIMGEGDDVIEIAVKIGVGKVTIDNAASGPVF